MHITNVSQLITTTLNYKFIIAHYVTLLNRVHDVSSHAGSPLQGGDPPNFQPRESADSHQQYPIVRAMHNSIACQVPVSI
jgi:hypothetical protein